MRENKVERRDTTRVITRRVVRIAVPSIRASTVGTVGVLALPIGCSGGSTAGVATAPIHAPTPAPVTTAARSAHPPEYDPILREGVLASSSFAPGLQPLDPTERTMLDQLCKATVDEIAARAGKTTKLSAPEAFAAAASSAPLDGPEADRCASLLLRSVRVERARTIEGEAMGSLRLIVRGLQWAFENESTPTRETRTVCPSAPPVPRDVTLLRGGPYQSSDSDWAARGWECLRFTLVGQPQRFQYELKVDERNGSFEAVARGFSSFSREPTELFIRGTIGSQGVVDPEAPVLRR